jgi:hypothetical protein
MRTLKMMALVLASMAVLPGLASATHFGDVSVGGDCEGWNAVVEVQWRTGIYTGDLDFTITLLDGDAVLEQVVWAGTIGRAVGDPSFMVYTFQGDWAGAYPGFMFNVTGDFHLVAPWDGGIDDETATYAGEFECSVATETSTWSTVKSLYR